jgi:hypothetical protein
MYPILAASVSESGRGEYTTGSARMREEKRAGSSIAALSLEEHKIEQVVQDQSKDKRGLT